MPDTLRHPTLTGLFEDIADAIRTKGVGSTDGDLRATDFDLSIGQIVTLVEGTTGDNAEAGDLLSGKKAHTANGVALTGTMTNQGAKTSTITNQGGTYTIPAGYHNGSGVITASITPSTIDNTIISGESVIEATDDYAWKTTVNVPAGYHNATTLTKTFSSIFPAPSTEGTASSMLAGYQLFDHNGKKITGTMPNNSATGGSITTQGGTYSIPAGYTSGGTVTANINNAVITSGAGSATISDPSYNSSTGKFDQSASGTVAAPTVGTAGYVSSTAGTKNTNTLSGSKSLNKVGTGVTITGTTTTKPSISRTAKPSGDVWIDAASGASTTTKPATAKPYVRVDTTANTGTLTATPKVTSDGYGTTSQYSATAGTATVGASASDPTYIPITEGALSAADSSLSGNSFTPTLTYNSSAGNFTYGGSANATGTAYAKASTAGYVTSSNNTSKSLSATVSATGSVAKVILGASASGTAKVTPSISKQSVPSGVTDPTTSDAATTTAPSSGVYVAVKSAASANTLTLNPSVSTAGYGTTSQYDTVAASSRQVSVGANASDTTYVKIKEATSSRTQPTASATSGTATITKQPSASASVTSSGIETSSTNTGYSVTASASSGSGTISATGGSASTTAGSVTVSAGYNKSDVTTSVTASSASGTSASTTERTASDSKTLYIKAATSSTTQPTASATAGTASIVNQPSASASTSVTGMVTTSTNTGYAVSASASANSGNSTATGGSASTTAGSLSVTTGYVGTAISTSVAAKSASGNTATSTAVSDSASDTKYIQKGALSASASVGNGSASMSANGFTAANSSNHYVSLSTSGGTATASAGVATEGYVKNETASGTATYTVSGNGDRIYIPDASPSFTGGTVSGSTSVSGNGNVTLSTTDNGIAVSSSGTANREAVLYNGAVDGYVSKADNTVALSAPSSAATLSGSTRYISGVTLPKDKGFTVTTTADTVLDTSSDLDVTNNAYRRVDITNNANGTVRVENAGDILVYNGSNANGNDISITNNSGSSSKTFIYNNSGSTGKVTINARVIINNGEWVHTDATAAGTYYGEVTVTGSDSAVSWTGPTGSWPKS